MLMMRIGALRNIREEKIVRVLVLAKCMDMGGTELALIALLNRLINDENIVDLMLIERKGILLDRIPKEVNIEELPFNGGDEYKKLIGIAGNYSLLNKVKCKLIRKRCNTNKSWGNVYKQMLDNIEPYQEKYDWLLDFHGYGYFMTAYGALKVKADKKAIWFHDENLWWIERVSDYLDYYDRWFCVSETVKEQLDKTLRKKNNKTKVLLNCIDVDNIRKKSFYKEDMSEFVGDFKILTIARLENQKGIDIAINVAKRLKDSGQVFNWYVIGDGSQRTNLQQQIKSNGLQSVFVLLGTKLNPYPYLKACDLYVQPSRHEGYGITIIEARVLGKTIVATNLKVIREQITDGENGYLVPLDEKLFFDKIEQLMLSPGLVSQIEYNLQHEDISYSKEYEHLKQLMEEI